ncbi:MAG: hypothetical protein K5644_03770 [Lachnospiraceae bacterium]|nr:hypothetical protein [Lachnospiraceae bacterium]
MMTDKELVDKLVDITDNYKTLYVMGCFGAPMTFSNKEFYTNNHDYNKKPERTAMIKEASEDTFGFDCSCLIKGVLWGWSGNKDEKYGGAVYKSNDVPDIDANHLYEACDCISEDFDNIKIGEALWLPDHIGIYIGNGIAVECSPKWDNCVQYSSCNRDVEGYNRRDWEKHGMLPYISYS